MNNKDKLNKLREDLDKVKSDIQTITNLGGRVSKSMKDKEKNLSKKIEALSKEIDKEEITPLEKEFREKLEMFSGEIQKNLERANEFFKKAIEISEEHGIPFESNLIDENDTYFPESFFGKFDELDCEILEEFDFYNQTGSAGWQESQYC